MNDQTRKVIAERAVSVWLKADLDLLVQRVNRRPGKRPLLAKGDPRNILEKLSIEREPVYALTDVHVTTTGGTKVQTRDAVLNALGDHLKKVTKNKDAAE